tara:strand:+ start:520 stop:657 length:138 start_codon:yes stop_codon:yes gene_type:complete
MDNITNAAVLEYQRIRIDALEKKVKELEDELSTQKMLNQLLFEGK